MVKIIKPSYEILQMPDAPLELIELKTLLALRLFLLWREKDKIKEDGKTGGLSFVTTDKWNLQAGAGECLVVRDCVVEVLGENPKNLRVHYVNQKFIFEVKEGDL